MDVRDTIAAISTAAGAGAIAIVRLSGPDSLRIAARMFIPAGTAGKNSSRSNRICVDTVSGGGPLAPEGAASPERLKGEVAPDKTELVATPGWESHYARIGYLRDPESGEIVDEVVLIPFRGPHTYTGEDLVEINCHGGRLIPHEILALCLRLGARFARPGEFTQRAFLSGRIDLTQAEAVLDLIQAKTSRQGQAAFSALSGQLGASIVEVRTVLADLLAHVTASLDFPDEVGDVPADEIENNLDYCRCRLEGLARTARSGKFLRDGLRLAIVGRPNAGKSSLLNQLLNFERAIVTDTPGTTRDSLEELVDINGIPVIFIDTAGVRPTDDPIEKIGIERTVSAIGQSDLVLFVVDLAAGWGEPEDQIQTLIGSRAHIVVGNKVDLVDDTEPAGSSGRTPAAVCIVNISATTGRNLPQLSGAVENWVFSGEQGSRTQPTLNARQAELCAAAARSLKVAKEAFDQRLPADCLATDLKDAINALSEVCGEAVSEEIIDKVFANFCIGK